MHEASVQASITVRCTACLEHAHCVHLLSCTLYYFLLLLLCRHIVNRWFRTKAFLCSKGQFSGGATFCSLKKAKIYHCLPYKILRKFSCGNLFML